MTKSREQINRGEIGGIFRNDYSMQDTWDIFLDFLDTRGVIRRQLSISN
jgi:hypothetical protein